MEAVLYLNETPQAAEILNSIRTELTNAVRAALLAHAYDTDIQLSFGTVHINARGSVSQISFNGTDVLDMDAFIVKQAFCVDDDHYYDIRAIIKEQPDSFHYYPIQIGTRVSLTVLKTSPYFEQKYGYRIHSRDIRVDYVSKYMIVYPAGQATPDVFYIGLFSPEATANTLLTKAGKTLGGKSTVYYCFMNSRPELFLHLGQVKSDFAAYQPEKNDGAYNFYRGSIISGVFRINKKVDANGKVKVKETKKACLKLIIQMQYGSVNSLCDLYGIDKVLLTAYLSGTEATVRYTNGNIITPTRLEDMLNLPFSPDADNLKNKNLLVKVSYDEIPE